MNVVRTAAAAAVLLAGVPLSAASAACNGTDATVKACLYPESADVDPDTGTLYEDCVALGDPEHCIEVRVPRPGVSVAGVVGEVSCGICATVVPTVTGIVMPVVNDADERVADVAERVGTMRCAPATAVPTGRTHGVAILGEKVREFLDSCL
ncbi:MAG TPA: hypothetical protein VGX28_05065 [Frankiaceae bacterium]|nr:hypothetical protein [Frankiaceae bacterium]